MNPSEITVIVYRGKGLHSKRKGKHKFNVTFGIENNKAKSENVDDSEGNPEWNTEGALNIEDPMEPLIIKVKDKDDILGQISLHMHELPTTKPVRPKSVPLQPHKKCPNPHGEVVFEAWVSAYSDHVPTTNGKTKHKHEKGTKLKKDSMHGSSESINSTVSGFSTMSEATKKKSALKRFKGAFSHSPKLGSKSKMHSKTNAAQSCMDLSYGGNLSVQNIDFKESRESLASQTSDLSKQADEPKKSSNPFKKMKQKLGKSPLAGRKEFSLSKKNSSSMHDLAFGGGLSLANHGSSDSLDQLGKSRMDASFPTKFDITAPTALLQTLAAQEEAAEREKQEQEEQRVREEAKKKEDTASIHSGEGLSPRPSQRRRLACQTRSLRDDPRQRQTLVPPDSPLLGRQVDALPSVGSKENIRAPTMGSSYENLSQAVTEKLGKDPDTRSIHSTHSHENGEANVPFYMQTPPAKKKLTIERPVPVITGVSPSQGPVEGGTKITIRGTNLGLDKADVVCLNVCGANCLAYLEYISDRKLQVTTKPWKAGPGKIIVETQSGGRANSLVEYTFIEESPKPPASPVANHTSTFIEDSPKPTSPSLMEKDSAIFISPSPAANPFADFGSSNAEEIIASKPPHKPKRSPNASPRQTSIEKSTVNEVSPVVEDRKSSPPPAKPKRVSKSPEQSPPSRKSTAAPSPPRLESSKEATVNQVDTAPQRKIIKARKEPPSPTPPVGQERQEPEGMTAARQHHSPVSKHKVDMFDKERSASPAKGNLATERTVTDEKGPSRSELLDMVRALTAEKVALQQKNASLNSYIEKIIDKVIDRCPDVLCIDTGASRSPLKL